jgi:hypothetical protein
MACKTSIPYLFTVLIVPLVGSNMCVFSRLARPLPPAANSDALDELPDTLDGAYERTLRAINNTNRETARRLLHCVAVASCPLRVDELADLLAIDFKADRFRNIARIWGVKNPLVLSTCSALLSVVDLNNSQVKFCTIQ